MAGLYPFDLSEVKVSKLLTDTGAAGPTYDAPIAFNAIQLLEIGEDEAEKQELRGNGEVQATSTQEGVSTFSLRNGGLPLDALAMIYDMTKDTSTPGTVVLYPKKGRNLPYFKIEGKAKAADGGTVTVIIYKAKANDRSIPPMSFEEGQFANIEIEGDFFWTISTEATDHAGENLKMDVISASA